MLNDSRASITRVTVTMNGGSTKSRIITRGYEPDVVRVKDVDINTSAVNVASPASLRIEPTCVDAAVYTDPKLVGGAPAAGTDLRPRFDSPLVEAGGTIARAFDAGYDAYGRPRPAGPGCGTFSYDIGAVEYQFSVPDVAITSALNAPVAPGATVTVTGEATDSPDRKSTALQNAWSFPGGSIAGDTATFTAPTTPGTYTLAYSSTDPTGLTSTAKALLMVVARSTNTHRRRLDRHVDAEVDAVANRA